MNDYFKGTIAGCSGTVVGFGLRKLYKTHIDVNVDGIEWMFIGFAIPIIFYSIYSLIILLELIIKLIKRKGLIEND